jgi:hypothetical protein
VLLEFLDPTTRDDLRRVLIRDQADRDAISSRLMRYRDQNGQDWADYFARRSHPRAPRALLGPALTTQGTAASTTAHRDNHRGHPLQVLPQPADTM